jgi:hypothetical protein
MKLLFVATLKKEWQRSPLFGNKYLERLQVMAFENKARLSLTYFKNGCKMLV